MKIPEHARILDHDTKITIWYDTAAHISMEYGIFVEVIVSYRQNSSVKFDHIDKIVFKVMDHEFESLKDLKKSLDLKAFL